jgi:carboxyl-terminal processing protease
MTSLAHGLFRKSGRALFLSGMVACLAVVHAQPAPDASNEAADRLWQSFVGKYNEFSLKPLEAPALDAKAREVLLATAGPKFRSWKPDNQPTFPELLAAVIAKDPTVPKFERIELTLTAMLPQIDVYGYYKPAADISQLTEALRQNPGSIHLTLDQSPDGRVLCFPLPDGPAELAGVNSGALLLAVDNRPAEGKSLAALRLAFVGPPNTPIVLKVRQPQGKVEEFSIIRTDKESPVVTTTKNPLGVTVRVRKFDKGSALKIKTQLEPYPKPGRLTLDLRGNGGGLREEALKTASLFFPEGTPLGKFTSSSGEQTANDGNGVSVEPGSIQILQDERTASAAEFLIAALKEGLPDKVTLSGKKTYGKSHSTAHVILEGGGELAVTECLLSTASGRSWEKSGIEPDHADKE